jgi:hypothetical protein
VSEESLLLLLLELEELDELELFDEELEPEVDRFLGFFFTGGSNSMSVFTFSAGLFKFLLRIFVRESLIRIFLLFLHS